MADEKVKKAFEELERVQRAQPTAELALQYLDSMASYGSFNLFGYDFMVTDDYKVSLIEVNSSPAVAEKLLPKLTEDLVEIVFDAQYPAPEEAVEGGFAEAVAAARPSEPNRFERVHAGGSGPSQSTDQ